MYASTPLPQNGGARTRQDIATFAGHRLGCALLQTYSGAWLTVDNIEELLDLGDDRERNRDHVRKPATNKVADMQREMKTPVTLKPVFQGLTDQIHAKSGTTNPIVPF